MTDIARYVNTIFCEDVRHELGGKVSFMGIYTGGSLIVPKELPVVIPKLCAVVNAFTGIKDPFEKLSIVLYTDDIVSSQIDIPEEKLTEVKQKGEENSDFSMIQIGVMFALPGLFIEKPCILRVEAKTEREVFLSAKLRIEFPPEPR